ncbi:MAG: ribbon-helix-helix domain-containing protein [Candidatus Rokuibacteriota bacterium]
MPAKVKVTVSVDESLIRELSTASRRTGKPRSRLVEEALRLWQRRQFEEALKEGYRAMAREDRATARRHLRAVREALE